MALAHLRFVVQLGAGHQDDLQPRIAPAQLEREDTPSPSSRTTSSIARSGCRAPTSSRAFAAVPTLMASRPAPLSTVSNQPSNAALSSSSNALVGPRRKASSTPEHRLESD